MSKDVRMQVQCEGYGCKIYGEGVRSDLLKIGWVCLEGAWHCPSCSGEMCSDAAPSPLHETEWTSTPPTEKDRWYWYRNLTMGIVMHPLELRLDDRFYFYGGSWCERGRFATYNGKPSGFEFWPEPIEPPRREP